ADGISGLSAGNGRAVNGHREALVHLASDGDVESPFGDVRSGVVRDVVYDGAGAGVLAGGLRGPRMASAAEGDSCDFGASDDHGRAALDAAPVVAGDGVPHRAREPLSTVVFAYAAVVLLYLVGFGGPRDDDFRIVAFEPRVRETTGTAAAAGNGAPAGGAP